MLNINFIVVINVPHFLVSNSIDLTKRYKYYVANGKQQYLKHAIISEQGI